MNPFEGVRALIIDDDATSVSVLKSMLDLLGIQADALPDPHRMLESLERVSTPHLIFLDLEMPTTNGYAILEFIRSLPAFDDVPVVAYTTHNSHLTEARAAGFDGFLGKPLDPDRFPDQIRRLLRGEPVWEQ